MAESCTQCPRECGADRAARPGFCGVSEKIRVARVGLHAWEEPCLSYGKGSGTVFFSGCSLRCVFCQNHAISRGKKGADITENQLADEMLRLQEAGAVNINLVTPTHYTEQIRRALDKAKPRLLIPVIYNCGGYEKAETLQTLEGYIDIFLPDIKYFSAEASAAYSGAPDYFEKAAAALEKMYDMVGYAQFNADGHMTRGVLTRHLVLPGLCRDSQRILEYLAAHFDAPRFAISLMSQYFPTPACAAYPKINRRVTTLEYNRVVRCAEELGFAVGFTQERGSACEAYVPDFDYTGNQTNKTSDTGIRRSDRKNGTV